MIYCICHEVHGSWICQPAACCTSDSRIMQVLTIHTYSCMLVSLHVSTNSGDAFIYDDALPFAFIHSLIVLGVLILEKHSHTNTCI